MVSPVGADFVCAWDPIRDIHTIMPPRAANIRKTLVALLDSCSAITQLVDAFKSVGANGHLSSSIIRSVAHKELHKYSELLIPYGTVIEK